MSQRNKKPCAHVRAPLDAQCIRCGEKMPLHEDEEVNIFGTVWKPSRRRRAQPAEEYIPIMLRKQAD